MATLNEIIVEWNGVGMQPSLSVLHFVDTISIGDARNALGAALNSLEPLLANPTTYSVRTEGRSFESTTGTLVGSWTSTSPFQGNGTGGSQPVSNATMLLLKSNTNTIFNGRFLKGRTFIPGVSIDFLNGGEFDAQTQDFVTDIFTPGFAAASGHVIWSRPTDTRSGSFAPVAVYTVWGEAAVLRRRR